MQGHAHGHAGAFPTGAGHHLQADVLAVGRAQAFAHALQAEAGAAAGGVFFGEGAAGVDDVEQQVLLLLARSHGELALAAAGFEPVLDGVFHQGLQQQRGHMDASELGRQVHLDLKARAHADLHQGEVVLQARELVAQGVAEGATAVQRGSQEGDEVLEHGLGTRRVGVDERVQVGQGVEHHVRVELGPQQLQLAFDGLALGGLGAHLVGGQPHAHVVQGEGQQRDAAGHHQRNAEGQFVATVGDEAQQGLREEHAEAGGNRHAHEGAQRVGAPAGQTVDTAVQVAVAQLGLLAPDVTRLGQQDDAGQRPGPVAQADRVGQENLQRVALLVPWRGHVHRPHEQGDGHAPGQVEPACAGDGPERGRVAGRGLVGHPLIVSASCRFSAARA